MQNGSTARKANQAVFRSVYKTLCPFVSLFVCFVCSFRSTTAAFFVAFFIKPRNIKRQTKWKYGMEFCTHNTRSMDTKELNFTYAPNIWIKMAQEINCIPTILFFVLCHVFIDFVFFFWVQMQNTSMFISLNASGTNSDCVPKDDYVWWFAPVFIIYRSSNDQCWPNFKIKCGFAQQFERISLIIVEVLEKKW